MKAVLRTPIALTAVIVLGFVPYSIGDELRIELNEAEFMINAVPIPPSPEREHFDAALGKPSRIDKKVHGAIYVYDDLGITYRTAADSEWVTDISLYRRDMSAIWSFSPGQRFNGSLKVAGREFPLGKPITEVMQAIPEMKPDPRSFRYVYHAVLGERTLSAYVDTKTHEIQTIDVIVQARTAPAATAQQPPCPSSAAYGQDAAAGRFAKVNGIVMYYETYGTGTPLLLIHGNSGSIRSMRCQISYFSRSRRVIVADSRSHGKTEAGTDPLTYELMADDLAALLDAVKVDAVDIVGHSDGGILALLLAIRHPTKVKKLVASSPNLRPDTTAVFPWAVVLAKRMVDEANTMMARGDRSWDWPSIKRRFELLLNEPHIPFAHLHRIQAPTLIIGADDDLIRPEHLLEIYGNLPNAHLFIMPGATHFMYVNQYELYNTMAERF